MNNCIQTGNLPHQKKEILSKCKLIKKPRAHLYVSEKTTRLIGQNLISCLG